MNLTQSDLKNRLSYDPNTGLFLWKYSPGGKAKTGSVAGSKKHGYVLITVRQRKYSAHRLAWLYMNGSFPNGEIDHIDGIRDNNAIINLRDVTRSVNTQNIKSNKKGNKLGLLGVNSHGRNFKAQIQANGKKIHIGCFKTAIDAHNAYLKAKRELHQGNTL